MSKQEFNIGVPILLKDICYMKINRPIQISQVFRKPIMYFSTILSLY